LCFVIASYDCEPDKKASIEGRWNECKIAFKLDFMGLDIANASELVCKYVASEEKKAYMLITSFLNANLSNIKFESNEEMKKFLLSLQSWLKKFQQSKSLHVPKKK